MERYTHKNITLILVVFLWLIGCWFANAQAGTVQVAVAANFMRPIQEIAAAFEHKTGHKAQLIFGSSGKLTAQIRQGAPFEVFLSADREKPARLIDWGLADPSSVFTYASGRLVLWSVDTDEKDVKTLLEQANFKYLAVANAKVAPYGKAANEVLQNLQVPEEITQRLVFGENIAQTYQFVHSGNADLGLIALSQVIADGEIGQGNGWVVPANFHAPIKQDAVLLKAGTDNPAAQAFVDFLKTPQSISIIRGYGYDLPLEIAQLPNVRASHGLSQ